MSPRPEPASRDRPSGVLGWFIHNRVAANLLLFGISLAGLLALGGVPQELVPESPPRTLTIRTVLPGAGAEAVEDGILIAVEEALGDVSGIREIAGLATEGLGVVTVRAESWADFRTLSDEVRERVEAIETLPRDAEEPVVAEVPPSRRLLRIGVHGNADERTLIEAARLVSDRVAAVPGVATVDILGGRDYEIAIEISEAVLTRFGLTFDQVAEAIRRGSADIPGGVIRTAAGDLRVGTDAEAAGAEEYARIPVIVRPGGGVVRVGDIATVRDGFADIARTARMNGEPAAFLQVELAAGMRVGETARAVRAEVGRLASVLPAGLSLTTWYDNSEVFDSRVELLVRNGLQGLALIFLVLFFTLSSRLAVWTAAGLPVAFFGAFLLMPGLGATVNMMTLFAFIITLGIVVDEAIVVGENVQRHIAAQSGRMSGGIGEAAARGVREVLLPAACGVLTTMAAFAPLLGLPGVMGDLMGAVPLVVLPVLAFSLLDAAWILPHHLAHGGLPARPSPRLARVRAGFQASLEWTVDTLYRPALRWSLHNRLATLALGVAGLALAASLVGGGWVLFESSPAFDGNLVAVQVSLPPGSPAQATAEAVDEVEAAVADLREEIRSGRGAEVQRSVATLVGERLPFGPGGALGEVASGSGGNVGQVNLELVPPDEQVGLTAGHVADLLRPRLRALPYGAEATVLSSLLGEGADLELRVSGEDPGELRRGAAALAAAIREYAGVIAVRDDLEGGTPELVARPRSGGAGTGVGAADFGRQLRQAFHGEEVQRIQRGRDELRVMLRYPGSERRTADAVTGMRVRRPDGGVTPLEEVADLSRADRFTVIRRVDGDRAVGVFADVDPQVASAGAVLGSLERGAIPALRERFPDLRFDLRGQAGAQARLLGTLQRNLIYALILIYGLLAVPLASWTQPLVILMAVPFGLAGAVFGHGIVGLPLSTVSILGMVPLSGIVVNDALVLLDFINRNRRGGMTAFEAAVAAGPVRFRPIILTTLTTCAGLAPLLLERSLQAEYLIPMAVSLAFGLAFATLVTLLIVPVLYSLADSLWDRSRLRN